MTSLAKAYQIIAIKCKFRIFVIVLDVMHGSSFTLPAVSLAASALISVAPQYRFSFSLPDRALIEFSFHNLSVQLTAYQPERQLGLSDSEKNL